jgi:hypothetical protein
MPTLLSFLSPLVFLFAFAITAHGATFLWNINGADSQPQVGGGCTCSSATYISSFKLLDANNWTPPLPSIIQGEALAVTGENRTIRANTSVAVSSLKVTDSVISFINAEFAFSTV